MSVQEIKAAIPQMTPDELEEITRALEIAKAERDAEAWDEQIERDVKAGRFDAIRAQIKADSAAGKLKPL